MSANAALDTAPSSTVAEPACVGAGCFFSSAGQPPYVYFGVSAIFAFIVTFLQTAVIFFHVRGVGNSRPRVLATFVLLWFSVLLRGVWFALRACDQDAMAEHYLNRLSMLLFFSGFTTYLQTWVQFIIATDGKFGDRPSELVVAVRSCLCESLVYSKPWVWNLLLNVSNWVVVFSLSFALHFGGCDSCKNWGYMVLSFECFLLSVGFLVFGLRMYLRLWDPSRHNDNIKLIARKVLCVLCVLCVCFGVRTVFGSGSH